MGTGADSWIFVAVGPERAVLTAVGVLILGISSYQIVTP